MRRRVTQPFDIRHLRALLQSFPFVSHAIQRLTRSSPDSLAATLAAQPSMSLVPFAPFLDFARNDKTPVDGEAEQRRRSKSIICSRRSKVLRSLFIKAGKINYEADEGHEEFVPETGGTGCHTIVTWQFSSFSL